MARLLPDLLLDLLVLLVVLVASSHTCEVAGDALRHAHQCLVLRLLSFCIVGVFSDLALLACCTTSNSSTSSRARSSQALSAQALRKRT